MTSNAPRPRNSDRELGQLQAYLENLLHSNLQNQTQRAGMLPLPVGPADYARVNRQAAEMATRPPNRMQGRIVNPTPVWDMRKMIEHMRERDGRR